MIVHTAQSADAMTIVSRTCQLPYQPTTTFHTSDSPKLLDSSLHMFPGERTDYQAL